MLKPQKQTSLPLSLSQLSSLNTIFFIFSGLKIPPKVVFEIIAKFFKIQFLIKPSL
jgi:hypothetical protein